MAKLNIKKVTQYVEEHIGDFHQKRFDKIRELRLKEILSAKNPYLFRAKNVAKASELIEGILRAFLSSSEETMFGDWLEGLARFVNESVYGGRKATGDGIDLDFDKEGNRYLVAIKSGPNWGNDSAIKKLIDQFNTLRKQLATSGAIVNAIFVNGCCYGKRTPRTEYRAKGNYYIFCGQKFWELISGDSNLYVNLIEPLGKDAKARNEEFDKKFGELSNRLEREFLENFCKADGAIDWDKLVMFNSAIPQQ